MIKVATSATAVDKFGDGVKSASWDESAKTLKIINEIGEEISINLSDVASASAVTTKLAEKLNIGTLGDTSSTQSYYGLKAFVGEEKLSAITAANHIQIQKLERFLQLLFIKATVQQLLSLELVLLHLQ